MLRCVYICTHRVKNAFFGFLICEVVGVDPYGSILAEPSHVNEKSNRTGQEKLLAKTSRKIGVWIVSLLVLAFDFGSDSDPLRRKVFFFLTGYVDR